MLLCTFERSKNFAGMIISGVYRIYPELELTLRIKPKKGQFREMPEPLAVRDTINSSLSMDVMQDQPNDGRSYRLLNAIDDFNREGDWH